jgi:hypothetical protein
MTLLLPAAVAAQQQLTLQRWLQLPATTLLCGHLGVHLAHWTAAATAAARIC